MEPSRPTAAPLILALGMAMLASSVTAIDDVPVPAPATEAQVEALISRLGDSGIAAAADGLRPDVEQDGDGGDLPGN